MIQSAARIGDLTLVVWGSSRNVTDTSTANVLYRQMLRDTMKLGEPEPLTDSLFDPFGFVQVIALNDHFMVVWNDRRSGFDRTWNVMIDTSGAVGMPQLWEGSHVPAGSGVRTVHLKENLLIVWNDTASESIIAQRADRNGMGGEGPFRLAGGYAADVFPGIPATGETLIDRGMLPPIVIAADGTIRNVEGKPAEKFAGVYGIYADGSVVNTANNRIVEYGSVTDTVPLRSRPMPVPKQINVWTTIEGSEYIDRDRSGRLRIFFNAYSLADVTRCYSDFCPRILEGLFMMTEQDSTMFGEPVLLDEEITSWVYHRDGVSSIKRYSVDNRQRLGNGAYRSQQTAVQIRAMYRPGQSPLTVYDTLDFTLLLKDTSAIWFVNAPTALQLQARHCAQQPGQKWIGRLLAANGSKITLAFDSTSLTLQAPVARLITSTANYHPHIVRAGNGFLVPALSFGFDSTALTYNWSGKGDPVSSAVPSNQISFFDRSDNSRYARMVFSYSGGQPLLNIFQSEEVEGMGGEEAFRSLHALYMLTEPGWKEIARTDPTHPSRFYSVLSAACDPDDGTVVVAAGWLSNLNPGQPADSITVTAYSPDGNLLWQTDSLLVKSLGFHLVPLQDQRFAGIGFDKRVYQFDGNSLLESGSPLPEISSSYRTFYDESFLWAYALPNTIHIEQRDSRGELIKKQQVVVNSGSGDYHFCFNPSDSAIALLYTRRFTHTPQENGVWAIILDKELRVTDTLRRISMTSDPVARPSGVFYNDTLYVVWEDYRGGNPEIYANAIVPVIRDTASGVVPDAMPTEAVIASISPNPATGHVRISLTNEAGQNARAELWDMRGNRVLVADIPVGSREFDLQCAPPAEGSYILHVRQNDRQECGRILIVR